MRVRAPPAGTPIGKPTPCLRRRRCSTAAALIQGKTSLVAVEPRNGQVLWKYDYETPYQPVASAATWRDTVFLPGFKLSALRPGAAGEEAKLLWAETRLRPDMASPIVCDGRIYVLKGSGVLACGDAASGRTYWQLRLKGSFWASPVCADGRLYCVNREGLVQVVQLGKKEGKLLASSRIDDGISASPAVAEGAVFFRSDRHLWKIAAKCPPEPMPDTHRNPAHRSAAGKHPPAGLEEHHEPGPGLCRAGRGPIATERRAR